MSHTHLKPPISQIAFRSSGDFEFAKVSNFDTYYKVVGRVNAKRSEYLGRTALVPAATVS